MFKNIERKKDKIAIFGKHLATKRKVAWYGDSNYSYKYTNTSKLVLPWTTELLDLKRKVDETTDTKFNSCLLNLYHDCIEGVTW